MGNFHLFGRGKINFRRGGYDFKTSYIASVHPGAYTSMPHPPFDAEDVCFIFY